MNGANIRTLAKLIEKAMQERQFACGNDGSLLACQRARDRLEMLYSEENMRRLVNLILEQEQYKPVAYWIPAAEQFCIAPKDGSRPFAKAWEPLFAAPAIALTHPNH